MTCLFLSMTLLIHTMALFSGSIDNNFLSGQCMKDARTQWKQPTVMLDKKVMLIFRRYTAFS